MICAAGAIGLLVSGCSDQLSIDVTNDCPGEIEVDVYAPSSGTNGWSKVAAGDRKSVGGAPLGTRHLEVIVREPGSESSVQRRSLWNADLEPLVEEVDHYEEVNIVVDGDLCPG